MRCPDCSFDNPSQARFCQNCGHALPRICPNCGASNQPQARFCLNCGHRLAGEPVPGGTAAEAVPAAPGEALPDPRLVHLASTTPQPLAEKIRAADHQAGERRLVTTLFADVVGSTALAETMDAEDWTAIMNRAFDLITPAVYRYEGTVARLMGDALLVFFGAPVAHEDDPERAVRAALDLLATIRVFSSEVRQRYGIDFAMRVGLSTGLVVVGHVGSNLIYEYTAMGDSVNLASRLQSSARPMTILSAESTYRFVSTVFDFVPLGEIQVKGKTGLVKAYEVTGVKDHPLRGRGLSGLFSPLVGRREELDQLLQLAQEARAGLGRVVILLGEAGVGKSRLVDEWKMLAMETGAENNLHWAEGHSLSYGRNLAYHLIADLLRNLLNVTDSAGPDQVWSALRERSAGWFGQEDDTYIPYFAHLLGLPLGEPELVRMQGLDPHALQARYSAAFEALLRVQSERGPLGLLLDDIHWADPSSVDLLAQLLPFVKEMPVIFCILIRPDPSAAGWRLVSKAHELLGHSLTEINLRSLDDAESLRLVTNLLNIDSLPAKLREMILEKAEGNPLFVEELIRMFIDRGYIARQGDRWAVMEDQEISDLPDNLQSLLLARIDRLPEDARATLRIAAVIGRRFSVRVLEEVLLKQGVQ